MKTSTKITAVAMAGMAAAQSIPACAINCFQDVITEHPPLECKEADMYHCFCKEPFGPDLQQWYLECCESDCGSTELANSAIQFGIDLCSEIGFPITVELPTSPATTSAAAVTTTEAAAVTTTPAAQSTTAAQESSAPPAETSNPIESSAVAGSTTAVAPGVTSTAASEPAVETTVASGSVSESASASASTSGAVSASGTASASVSTSGSATASVSGSAGVSSSAVASASHGHGAHGSNTTVIDEVSVTTTVCPESEQATAVVTVTSAVQVCPGGCSGSPSGSSITVITKPSSPSDDAHASPSQGGAAPSGSGAVVPTKSTGGSGSGSSSAASSAVAEPSTVVVNAGNTGSVSGLMAAAGVAAAVLRLL